MTDIISSATAEPVHKLLSGESTKLTYVIPKYQREYSWAKYQWEDLIRDIQEEGRDNGHFLGTIICMDATKDPIAGTTYELIDGQQRMTTLSLLLAVLYAELRTRKADFFEDDERMGTFLMLKSRLAANGEPRLRLQTQAGNADDYRWLLSDLGLLKSISAGQPYYWGVRRIARAYRFFQDEIARQLKPLAPAAQLDHLFDLIDRVNNSVLVRLDVKDHASAYTLFESLNNRGMPLSPIDLIKNSLLMRADKMGPDSIDEAYEQWQRILTDLGEDPNEQERFLRYYYNVFEPVEREAAATPIATRTNLIRLYEKYLDRGVDEFLRDVGYAARQYGRIIDTVNLEDDDAQLDRATTNIQRAQGAPGNALMMYLLVRRQELGLSDAQLTRVADLVTRFFVRRNLTSFPATYELPHMFKSVSQEVAEMRGDAIVDHVREHLLARSSSDEVFRDALNGPIYEDNVGMCRFVLTALAEEGMTKETWSDLWQMAGASSKRYYLWTIEHIFPQGPNVPASWQDMLGGPEQATQALETHVHRLGNLTLTGYNSSLGNKSFTDKRDRVDQRGNNVGYRNGLNLNKDLASMNAWTIADIDARTDALVNRCLEVFAL